MNKPNGRTLRGLAALSFSAVVLAACGPDTSGEQTASEEVDVSGVEPADEITSGPTTRVARRTWRPS